MHNAHTDTVNFCACACTAAHTNNMIIEMKSVFKTSKIEKKKSPFKFYRNKIRLVLPLPPISGKQRFFFILSFYASAWIRFCLFPIFVFFFVVVVEYMYGMRELGKVRVY